MKNTDNIEKLFKETFEHFESDVNPQSWSAIQSGINPTDVGSIAGNTVSSTAKFAIGKIIAGAVSIGLIAGSVWYFSSLANKTNSLSSDTQHQVESSSNPDKLGQNIISENKSTNTPFNLQPEKQISPLVSSFNKNASDNSQQAQIVYGKANNADTSGASVSENTANISTPPEQHKYGRSSAGQPSLIRGMQHQNPKSKSFKNNPAPANQNTEQTPPHAAIWASIESGNAPLTVNFSNLGVASTLNWDFGDGTASRENAPSHTFKNPGNYVVKLAAKNWSGNTSDEITIEVKTISGIINTPNIFTPNGDGENDFFLFEFKSIISIEVIISDLNGGLINKWSNLDGKWNGKLMNGDDAADGLYFYAIRAMGADGIMHSSKGTVTLSRKSER